jgi:alpha-galactosidase
LGRADATLRIVIGETLCLTPPMAWNSWYCWSESVSQEHLCAAADALVGSGLAEHGWSSVNVDDCWQGERTGPDKALQGNGRFAAPTPPHGVELVRLALPVALRGDSDRLRSECGVGSH